MRVNEDEKNNIGFIMSNYDLKVIEGSEEKLKQGNTYGEYPAMNFFGNVWYEENQFQCEIWTYGSYIETIAANTLKEIMTIASEKFGWN